MCMLTLREYSLSDKYVCVWGVHTNRRLSRAYSYEPSLRNQNFFHERLLKTRGNLWLSDQCASACDLES
jgi:hypothetical protein